MNRRLVTVPMAFELLQEIFTTGWKGDGIECIDGLPKGSELMGSYSDGRMIVFVFQHESFDAIPAGKAYPRVTPVYRKATTATEPVA